MVHTGVLRVTFCAKPSTNIGCKTLNLQNLSCLSQSVYEL